MLLVHLGFSKKALLAAKRGNYNLPDWYINHVKPLCIFVKPVAVSGKLNKNLLDKELNSSCYIT